MAILENWFPVPIWFDTIEDVDNKKLAKQLKDFSKKNEGRVLSNYGGWQSNDLYLHDCTIPQLKTLAEIVLTRIQECCQMIKVKSNMQARLSNFWININSKGNGNNLHTHPTCALAAVYYVQTPDNCGKLQFEHPSHMINYWMQSYTESNTYSTFECVDVQPSEGKLVVFPAWLKHAVQANQSDSDRISIAFNTDIVYK